MNSVGIDVSKGKSTVAIMRPFGEIVASPFEINHTEEDFEKLVSQIKSLKGEFETIREDIDTLKDEIELLKNKRIRRKENDTE